MRYNWMWVMLAALLASALPAAAVEYADGQDIYLTVQASDTTVSPGGTVRLTISATDTDYQVGPNNTVEREINDLVTLSWDTNGGSLRNRNPLKNNPAELVWTAPQQPGYYAIYITADDSGKYADEPAVRRLVEITVQRLGSDLVPALRVAANPQTVRLDRGSTTTITAQVLGNNVGGREVTFFATGGSLNAAKATTDANGVASVRLTVSRRDIGTVRVSGFYGNTTATTTVEVVERAPAPSPVEPPLPIPLPPANSRGVLVDVLPASIPADGRSTALVSVRVTDLHGLGIPGRIVYFRTTMGGLMPPRAITDGNGFARTQILAPTRPGVGLISAEIDALRGYAQIEFTPLQQAPTGPPRLFLTIDPSTLTADGTSKARVEALVLDSQGYAAVNTPVTFSATLGTLQATTVNTDASGRAVTTLTAPDRAGLAVVTASVGPISAASQVVFQGAAPQGPSLDVRSWNSQQVAFVAENWLYRQVQVEDGTAGGSTRSLQILDAAGKVAKEIALGKNAIFIRDQYGIAHGYVEEGDGKAQITLLKTDGSTARTFATALQLGSHPVLGLYAEPAGLVALTLAQPDGTRPEVYLFSATGEPVRVFRDGLESMPVVALNGEGYFAVALAGGTVQLFGPTGLPVAEGRRTDGLPATVAAIGPGAAWVAVASALPGQEEKKPVVTVFSRQGTVMATIDAEARGLAAGSAGTVVLSTPDRTICYNLGTRRADWSLPGGFARFLAANDRYGIVAGARDAKTQALVSRIVVVRLATGAIAGTQDFNDFQEVIGVLPPNDKGLTTVVSVPYVIRFPLPAENN